MNYSLTKNLVANGDDVLLYGGTKTGTEGMSGMTVWNSKL